MFLKLFFRFRPTRRCRSPGFRLAGTSVSGMGLAPLKDDRGMIVSFFIRNFSKNIAIFCNIRYNRYIDNQMPMCGRR